MGLFELFLIAVGLSMDAFAISLCKGLNMRRINYFHSFVIALFFGGFQALMPIIGWLIGSQFERFIINFDHWIAFALLLFIGGKMIYESIKGGDEDNINERLDIKELFIMAIATSIDALAVGITFAFLQTSILPAASLIGVTTFVISFAGVSIGNHFGARFKSRAEILGGAVLILIGTKILLEHLGILSF